MKTLSTVLVGAALVAWLAGGMMDGRAQDKNKSATAISHADPAQAEKLILEKKVIVLDVRTPKEYRAGHIAGAKNIDFNGGDFKQQVGKLDKRQNYLVHCAAGGRSTKSLETFKELGFSSVVHLDGGFRAWEKAAKPVEK